MLFPLTALLYLQLVAQEPFVPPPPPPPSDSHGGVVGGTVGGEGKCVDCGYGATPSLEEESEMRSIAADLYPQLLYFFQTTSSVTHQSNDNGEIKISNGFRVYKDPYPEGQKPQRRAWSNVEGPEPGCYVLRVRMAMSGAEGPMPRGQVFEQFKFGKWYFSKATVPHKRYEVWFDFISPLDNAPKMESEIRKLIESVISKHIPNS